MLNLDLPKDVAFVLKKLKDNGFEAYIVGGCVRDILLKKTPTDFDIATSSLPETTKEIFKGFNLSLDGIVHGTVSVKIEEKWIEITTFRIDGKYTDSRRPNSVNFTKSIAKDLERRDFTINACAMNNKKIVDPFNAINDIKQKTIRCIGVPKERFEEDALRILRAIRFMSVLGFHIEASTKKAIFRCKHKLTKLSKERIKPEFTKTLLGKNATKSILEFLDIYFVIFPNINTSPEKNLNITYNLDALNHLDNCLLSRLAIFFSETLNCVSKDSYTKIIKKILDQMNFSKKDILTTLTIIEYINVNISSNHIALKKHLIKIGESTFKKVLTIKRAKFLANSDITRLKELEYININLNKLLQNNPCLSIGDLEITGNDLIEIGIKDGKQIGKILNELFEKVINEQIPNEHKALLSDVSLSLKAENLKL